MSVYGQSAIGETPEAGDNLGAALTFGAFDATGNGTLIVGVPGEDSGTGLVHVVAPWRQFYFQGHKTAIVRDCQGDIVFSQKPFEQVYIASTTKILTVLLACEHSQLPPGDPGYVPLSALYEVPDWVADDIGGSTADLQEGEILSLESLMYLALLISGNDAAHAIADLIYGANGPEESVAPFVEEMNERAIELGMYDSHFNNPNGFEQEAVGRDLGDHYSTAWDMEILSREAMRNPLFREISETVDKTVLRARDDGPFWHNFQSFQSWILNNNWGVVGSGLKGGWTPAAQTTWCVSVEGVISRAIATTFGTDQQAAPAADAMRLVTLGLADCGTWQYHDPNDWELEYLHVQDGIVAEAGATHYFENTPTQPQSMEVNLFQANADVSELDSRMRIRRRSEIAILPDESVPFEIAPFEGHDELRVTNMSDRVTKIRITTPQFQQFFNIGPGGTVVVPATTAPAGSFSWTVQSFDGDSSPLHLSVEESYRFDVQAPAEPTTDPVFHTVVERDPRCANDVVGLEILWHRSGGEYVMTVHELGLVTDTPELPSLAGTGESVLQLAPAAPNPFADETRIRFANRYPRSERVTLLPLGFRRRSWPDGPGQRPSPHLLAGLSLFFRERPPAPPAYNRRRR